MNTKKKKVVSQNYKSVKKELKSKADPKRAKILQRFFKTRPGEYGEGDVFLGVTVPESRIIAKEYSDFKFEDIKKLLDSKIHEERLVSLLILVFRFQENSPLVRRQIYNFYLKNTKFVNNWDLVDLTAHKIVGAYLFDKPRNILYKLVKSKNLWEKRISIISTFWFINHHDFKDSLKIAKILLNDEHDLIHKAVGWMLREVGKKDFKTEEKFLRQHYKRMPRTMLRYAIEKFPENLRQRYLKGKI